MTPAIAVHGGAGRLEPGDAEARTDALRRACRAGAALLAEGRSALDAVEHAVAALEDAPGFNAGTGSVLSWDGRVEMDASIMGENDAFGGVAALGDVRHPVRVARRVLEGTDHWLLAGEGALAFARSQGFGPWRAETPARRERWRALRAQVLAAARGAGGESPDPALRWSKLVAYVRDLPEVKGAPGTVGAVALDIAGRAAAATSTGGMWLKLAGRVGDSALPGAGTFVGPGGAVSATGHGEAILRVQVGRRLEGLLRELEASRAAARAVEEAAAAGCACGVIAVDRRGRLGSAFNTAAMPVEVWRG
jgi:beta-aspartyl-peptidase (threonine type)